MTTGPQDPNPDPVKTAHDFRRIGRHVVHWSRGLVVLSSCGLVVLCSAAPPKPGASAKAAPPEPEIPHSVFTSPANPKEGKDPFFPTSMRPFTTRTSAPKPTIDASALALNGIIPRVSVMINGKTFYKGDEADVKDATGGRIHVKCIEVKEDSALIDAGGERRELHLRHGVF